MTNRGFCGALSLSMTFAVLAGCGGSQPPTVVPEGLTRSRATVQQPLRATSWILPEAKRRDLLYIANPANLFVYTYPKTKYVGVIHFTSTLLYGECVDTAGDVFVVDYFYGAYEFRHGETRMLASIYNPAGSSQGCSVDPVTGKLAIASYSGNIVVSTFAYSVKRGWRFAKTYKDSSMDTAHFCSYDNQGNLFVDGDSYGSGGFVLAELPAGGKKLVNLTVDQPPGAAGQLQWDGEYLAVADPKSSPTEVRRFSITPSGATQVGTLSLDGSTGVVQFWIQDHRIIGPEVLGNTFAFWPYPEGGDYTNKHTVQAAYGAVVSRAR